MTRTPFQVLNHLGARAYVAMSSRAARLRDDVGGQHTEEGALIATLAAVGAGVAAKGTDIGDAISAAWTGAIGG